MSQSPSTAASSSDKEGLRDYLSAWLAIGEMSRQGSSWSGRERNTLFLNTADGRFSDISSSSGADFPDDGRAAATTDWDGDGDLDIWIASRTGPRMRFLRNQIGNGEDFIAFRLRGREANRDAIGARVRLNFEADNRPRIQTLRAGEGFLAQSSKWIHFGLSGAAPVEKVEVRWPGGDWEAFPQIQRGRRFLLEQGTGTARELPSRGPVDLMPSSIDPAPLPSASHIRLTARPSVPPLGYRGMAGDTRRLALGDGPVLLNLWASWCAPCVGELRELEAQRVALADQGLSIIALSVDEEESRARALLEQIEPSFEVGLASPTSLDVLDILQKALLEERLRLALPMSFLIDARGRLAVIYKGTIDMAELRADLSILELDDAEIRAATAPLPGRWATLPTPFPSGKLAGEFASFGYPDIAEFYRRLAGRAAAHGTGDAFTSDLDRGFQLLEQGRPEAAEAVFGNLVLQLADELRLRPEDTQARNRLGIVLLGLNRPGAALQAFEQVLELDPADITALGNAAYLNWRGGREERARELIERLATLDPAAATEIRRATVTRR